MKKERKNVFGALFTMIMFLCSSLASFVAVTPVALADPLGDGIVLSYKPNTVTAGEPVTLEIEFQNNGDGIGDDCIDEIIIMPPDTWGGSADVTLYDRSTWTDTQFETNDNINLVADAQSVRIQPDSSLCTGETVNIVVEGLLAPGAYEVSDIVIKTSDIGHNNIGGAETWGPIADFPEVYVTTATGIKKEYFRVENFGSSGFDGRAWGAWARLSTMNIDAPAAGTLTISVETGTTDMIIFNKLIPAGPQTLMMQYSSWDPTVNSGTISYGYLADGAGAREYHITFTGGTLAASDYLGLTSEILDDIDYVESGLTGAQGRILTAGSTEQRKVLIQAIDSDGNDVFEVFPLEAMVDPEGSLSIVDGDYTTASDGHAFFTLEPGCEYGVHDFTVYTDPLSEIPSVTENVGVDADEAFSYAVTEGDGVDVPAGEDQLIEVTVYDECGNTVTNTNQVDVTFNYLNVACGDINKLADVPGGPQSDQRLEPTDMGISDVYLITDCELCTHDVEITLGAPLSTATQIELYGVNNVPYQMQVTIDPIEITADMCIDALIEVTDECGNVVEQIPSEVGDHMEEWESIVRVTVEDALNVDQPGWASQSYTTITQSDFREEYIYSSSVQPYVQGKLNDGAGLVEICGCQGLGSFLVVAESDTIMSGNDSVSVINADWDCIETTITDGQDPLDQLLVCEEGAQVDVAIKDICGNFMQDQETCGEGEANYCVDLSLSGSCAEDAADLSTETVCVDVGTAGPGFLEYPVDLFRNTEDCCEIILDAAQGTGCCPGYPLLEQCEDSSLLFHGPPAYMTTEWYKTRQVCVESEIECEGQTSDNECIEEAPGVWCYEQLHEVIPDMGTEVVSEEVLDLFTVYDACDHIVKDFNGSIDVRKENEDCASIYQVDHPLTLEDEQPGQCTGQVPCEGLAQIDQAKCEESGCLWEDAGNCSGVPVCADMPDSGCTFWGCEWDPVAGECFGNPDVFCGESPYTWDDTQFTCESYLGCTWEDTSTCEGIASPFGTCDPYTKEQCLLVGETVEGATCEYFQECIVDEGPDTESIIKKLVIHNCADETVKQWTPLELDDIMVDKLAFYIDHEIDPSLWVYVYRENEAEPGFQLGQDPLIGKAPMLFEEATIIEIRDSPTPYMDDQRQGGVLIRAGDSQDFYIMLVNQDPAGPLDIPCGTYSAQFLYYQDYTSADFAEFGSGHPDSDGDGVIEIYQLGGNARDGCLDSDNHNWIDGPFGPSTSCPQSGPGLMFRGDSRNDDYVLDFPWNEGPTPFYGFGDVYIDDLRFSEGQAWTKQRDLTAETIRDYVIDIQSSGYCDYSEIVLAEPPVETITFIAQPATQIKVINHEESEQKTVTCSGEIDQNENAYHVNIQVTDGFDNPVGKEIEVELEYCMKAPFGDWFIESAIAAYCDHVYDWNQFEMDPICRYEQRDYMPFNSNYCFTPEDLKKVIQAAEDVHGLDNILFGEYFGGEFSEWVDKYFAEARVEFWDSGNNPLPTDAYGHQVVTTDSNGQAEIYVTAQRSGLFEIIARPLALDGDSLWLNFNAGSPAQLDLMALPAFGVPADGEQEALLFLRALDVCDNLADSGVSDVTVEVTDGEQVYISQDFDGKNNYDGDVTGDISGFGFTNLAVLSDLPQVATLTASASDMDSDDTTIAFQGAPVALAITAIEPSDRLPADGQTGAWVTIQVQDKNGNRVTGYKGDGYAKDPGDPWGYTDFIFEDICVDLDDTESNIPFNILGIFGDNSDIDLRTFGWLSFNQLDPFTLWCGDLAFGEGKVYVTYGNFDCNHGGTVEVTVFDDGEFQGQEFNENGIPVSDQPTQLRTALGEIDFVDPASQWDIMSDKVVVLADGSSTATIEVQVENEYMDVRQAVEGNVYVGGTASDGAQISWNGMMDELNPTSARMITDPVTGRATLELTSTEPGIAEITVVGGDAYACLGIDDITLSGCLAWCGDQPFGADCFALCLSGDIGFYNCPTCEEYIPKAFCEYSRQQDLTPKTITIEFIEVADNEMYLDEGWNFISVPYALVDNDASVVFADVIGDVSVIYEWDSVGQVFAAVGGADPIEPLMGYWVLMTASGVISLDYATPAFPSIPQKSVNVGWETFGLTVDSPITAESALISIDDSYSLLIDWVEGQQRYDLPVANTGENGGGAGSFKTGGYNVEPKQGYWVWVDQSDTLAGLSGLSS